MIISGDSAAIRYGSGEGAFFYPYFSGQLRGRRACCRTILHGNGSLDRYLNLACIGAVAAVFPHFDFGVVINGYILDFPRCIAAFRNVIIIDIGSVRQLEARQLRPSGFGRFFKRDFYIVVNMGVVVIRVVHHHDHLG